MRILIAIGTRPEAIKMAPVIMELKKNEEHEVICCATGQHREMLDQVLKIFNINPAYDLNIMRNGQGLEEITGKIICGIKKVIHKSRPDIVLVHGDTTTAMAATLAAYYSKVPIGHVEAGLRSGDLYSPWPEEGNRKIIAALAQKHFAPTESAKNNLILEGVHESKIEVTGNTVIDALRHTEKFLADNPKIASRLDEELPLDLHKKTVLVTAHRRESFGREFENIAESLHKISLMSGVQVIYPVHPNPSVKSVIYDKLSNKKSIHLTEPMDYVKFVRLMQKADVILTDSGGIQEEAPYLKKQVLVIRKVTERTEAIKAGTAKIVGTNVESIVSSVEEALNKPKHEREWLRAANPFGDGYAATRIARLIKAGNN